METQRLFIAITLPEPVKDEVARTQSELRRAVPGNFIRWTKREQFHLTMRFLGNVEVARTEALVSAVREACLVFAPMRLRAEGLGFFPNAKFPRVMWVGVRDAEEYLQKLHLLIDAAVEEFTHEKPEPRFVGHVTLARIQNIRPREAELLSRTSASISDRFFGEWNADKLEIIRSELSSAGAKYQTLAEIPFGGGLD